MTEETTQGWRQISARSKAVRYLFSVVASSVVVLTLLSSNAISASGQCNVADMLFGDVRIDLIQYDGYQTAIIFGNDFNSNKFQCGRILGMISAPERDGSRAIRDLNGTRCVTITEDLEIDSEDGETSIVGKLRKISKKSFVLLSDDESILGSIEETFQVNSIQIF